MDGERGAAPDKSWEYRETHWEKAGAERVPRARRKKSGLTRKERRGGRRGGNCTTRQKIAAVAMMAMIVGIAVIATTITTIHRLRVRWWNAQPISGRAHVDTNSDSSREWQEKWWERFSSKNTCDRGVEKSGRENRHAWWEKWGEHYDPNGISLRWTDKWAENDKGVRWGDKWEERLKSSSGDGAKSGETWREQPNGEVWRRTWGEEVSRTARSGNTANRRRMRNGT